MITRAGAVLMPWKFLFLFHVFPPNTIVVIGVTLTVVLGSRGDKKKFHQTKEKKRSDITFEGLETHKPDPLSPVFAKYV